MDPDGDTQIKSIKRQGEENSFFQRYFHNASNVFFTLWLRWTLRDDNELDRFLLDYRRNFLPYFGIIFYLVYILYEIVK